MDCSLKNIDKIHDLFSDFHDYFKAAVDLAEFKTNEEIETAHVYSDENKFYIEYNPKFWESLDFPSQCFVFIHELTHIVFGHLNRFVLTDKANRKKINVAMDLFVNQWVCKTFGFNRYELHDTIINDCCWVDTVFDDPDIKHNESTEYYFNRLPDNDSYCLVFDPFGEESEINNNMDQSTPCEEDDQKLSDQIQRAGSEAMGRLKEIQVKLKRKKPWESVIKKWVRQKIVETRETDMRWGWPSRKLQLLQRGNMLIQGEGNVYIKHMNPHKINLWMFLDTSGSCVHLANRFFSAAAAIPPDRFNVRLFSFDTRVYELDLKHKQVKGGGGTSFNIIENRIKQEKKYPDGVFVITDGYGNNVNPQFPERWYWFLTSAYKTYIPAKSHTFNLNNYA